MTEGVDWQVGHYALDRHDRLWHAWSWHFGTLIWRGLGLEGDWRTDQLQDACGPLRRVQIVEVRE